MQTIDSAENLPTVTLNEILNYIHDENVIPRKVFSSGSCGLDELLSVNDRDRKRYQRPSQNEKERGINRGSIVEISGPPGSGKTTIGLTLAKEALRQKHRVLWVSTTEAMIPISRLRQLKGFSDDMLQLLSFVKFSTLSQLIIYFQRYGGIGNSSKISSIKNKNETGRNNASKNALIVIEDLAFLFNLSTGVISSNLEERQRQRTRTMYTIIESLYHFAKKSTAAVLILSSVMTRPGKDDALPTLIPGLGYGGWQRMISRRIVLFRDEGVGGPRLYAKEGDDAFGIKITTGGIENYTEDIEGEEIRELKPLEEDGVLNSLIDAELAGYLDDSDDEVEYELLFERVPDVCDPDGKAGETIIVPDETAKRQDAKSDGSINSLETVVEELPPEESQPSQPSLEEPLTQIPEPSEPSLILHTSSANQLLPTEPSNLTTQLIKSHDTLLEPSKLPSPHSLLSMPSSPIYPTTFNDIPDSPPVKRIKLSSNQDNNSLPLIILPDEIPNSQPEWSDSDIIIM